MRDTLGTAARWGSVWVGGSDEFAVGSSGLDRSPWVAVQGESAFVHAFVVVRAEQDDVSQISLM